MHKLLLRIIACLLVAGLISDPVSASALSQELFIPQKSARIQELAFLQTQALSAVSLEILPAYSKSVGWKEKSLESRIARWQSTKTGRWITGQAILSLPLIIGTALTFTLHAVFSYFGMPPPDGKNQRRIAMRKKSLAERLSLCQNETFYLVLALGLNSWYPNIGIQDRRLL